MFGSIELVGALTRSILPFPLCDLKDSKMNVQRSPVQEHMLYKLEVGHNAVEATKNIYHIKVSAQLIIAQ